MALIEKNRVGRAGWRGSRRAGLRNRTRNPARRLVPSRAQGRGRRAEGGKIADRYELIETPYPVYSEAAEWNVRDSDGTVVFSIGAELSGGSQKTVFLAHRLGKPLLRIWRDGNEASPERTLLRFIQEHSIRVLNVAGPRASKEPEVYGFVTEVLTNTLAQAPEPRGAQS